MHNFRELKIWQKSRKLVKLVYKNLKYLPEKEKFGLRSQMSRAAISIPSNIAEGCGRGTNKDLNRFLDIATGSAFELETLIILCNDLGFIEFEKTDILIMELQEIEKMIFSFKSKLSISSD